MKTPAIIIVPPITKMAVIGVPKINRDRIAVSAGCRLLKTESLDASIFVRA